MFIESVQRANTAHQASVYVAGMPAVENQSDAEVHSLHQRDTGLPDEIRANFKAMQESKAALFAQLNSPWNDTTEALFIAFDQSVRHHLRVISEKMYVPVRKSLRVERAGSYERFKIFESRARKTNELVAIFLRKYHRSNEFFNTEFVQDVKTDVTRIVDVLTEQLGRERAYLFPVYLSKG